MYTDNIIYTNTKKLMKRGLLSLLLLFCSLSIAIAQQKVVKGVVTSSDDKLPVIGAAVVVVGQEKIGASTNLDGEFSFSVPSNTKQLRVTSMGYKPQVVAVKSGTLQIVLQPDNQALDELVVTAYGTVKKQSLVGSQASIDSKKLESRPITNVSSALIGAAPGVQVLTSSGQPGSSSAIRIRGFGSLNASSAPLIVVDGAVYNGSLSDINTNDIKSVSILKDAASTALYGSSAGNGVLLITTKSGTRGGGQNNRPQITFSVSQGFNSLGMPLYDRVNTDDWMRLEWRKFYNERLYNPNPFAYQNPEQAALWAHVDMMDDITPAYFPYKTEGMQKGIVMKPGTQNELIVVDNPAGDYTPYLFDGEGNPIDKFTQKWADDVDWKKGLFRLGNRREYNLSSSWANDYIRTFLSAGYLTEEGSRYATNFDRFTARANVGYDVNKYLTLGVALNYMRSESKEPRLSRDYYNANSFWFLSTVGPFVPIHQHNRDGSYVLDASGSKVYDHNWERRYRGGYNPIEATDLDGATSLRDAVGSRLTATANILPELSLTTNFSYDLLAINLLKRFNNVEGDQAGKGLLEKERYRTQTYTFNQLLNYKKSFDGHNFDVLLGHENYAWEEVYDGGAKSMVMMPEIDEFPNYVNIEELVSETTTYRKEGYFARLNYDYQGLYTGSFSYRRDGSSRFARNKRWGNFWSVGAGWNIIREDFMSQYSWVDNLRLRLSVGQTGNDALSSYYAHFSTLYSLGKNNNSTGGILISSYGNPDLVWEAQTSYDVAVDFGFFNRIRGSLELFAKESDDLIFATPLVHSTGATSISKNLGKIRNYGLEADINVDVIKNKDFRWSLGLNATFFRNKIVRLPEENRADGIISDDHKLLEGKSIYDFYLPVWKGVDSGTGRSLYLLDEDILPGASDPKSPNFLGVDDERPHLTYLQPYAKKDFAGSAIPDVYGGFSTEFSWRNLTFSANFAYQLGGKMYDSGYQGLMGARNRDIGAYHVDNLKAWVRPGDQVSVPAFGTGNVFQYNFSKSNQFLTSRSALMLKTLALSYDLPQEWFQQWGVKGLRVGLVGENLFLLSARKGMNPMQSFGGSEGAPTYQFSRSVTANLTLTL